MRTKLFLLLIILSLNYLRLNAQIDPNTLCPPCSGAVCSFVSPSDEYVYVDANGWGHLPGTYYENNSVCYYDIVFKVRECVCPGGEVQRDIYIGRIIFPPNCSSMNYSNIMRSAIKLLLRFAPVYFGIEQWPTRFDVSIVMPACWDYIDNPNGTPYLEPCYPYECCKTKYGVINYGRYLSDKERILIPQSNCSGVVQSDCFYYCDVNDLPIGSLLDQNSTTCSNDPCSEVPWDDTFYDSNCECNDLFNPGGVNCCPPPQSGCTYYDCSYHGSFVGKTHIRVPMDMNFPTKIAYFYTSFKICPVTGRRVIRVEKVFLTPDLCYDASITNLDIFLFEI